MITAVYILRLVGKILYGTCTNKHHLALTDATWDERFAVICLIICVAGLGMAPFWVSHMIGECIARCFTLNTLKEDGLFTISIYERGAVTDSSYPHPVCCRPVDLSDQKGATPKVNVRSLTLPAVILMTLHTVINLFPGTPAEAFGRMYQYTPMQTIIKAVLNVGTIIVLLMV